MPTAQDGPIPTLVLPVATPDPLADGPVELFDTDLFAGFGPSVFRTAGDIPLGRLVRARGAPRLKAGVRDHAPRHPGVYSMLDGKGRVVYVGKAKVLRTRLLSYFREKSRDPKAGKIVAATRTLVWEECPDELGALLRELELIRRYRPKFNVVGMPGPRRYVYLCLGRGPAPALSLTRTPSGKELGAYGPFVGRGRLFDAVRKFNDTLKLRDCSPSTPMHFADQPGLFTEDRSPKCLRYEMGTCPGPCAGLTTRRQYDAGARSAKAFLDGTNTAPLSALLKDMRIASTELRFEAASALRDKMLALDWLNERLTFLRTARQGGAFVYPLAGPDGRRVWYLIHHGTIHAAVREPAHDAGKARAATLMTEVFAAPAGAVTYATVDSVLLVAAWFRKNPDGKPALLTREQAYARCGVAPPDLPPNPAPAVVAGLPDDLDPIAGRRGKK